ncbi:MAG: hypothetical protein VKJ24_15250 [Synechococcales bacterium]|nr:hypothetical protein [Synechococcales bacterium]
MRRFYFDLPVLAMLIMDTIAIQPVFAADPVKPVTPQMTVVGERCVMPISQLCFGSLLEFRTLQLQAATAKADASNLPAGQTQATAAKPIKAFRVLATDFERKENPGMTSNVQVSTNLNPQDELLPGKYLTIPLRFDLGRATKSGEFTGNLLIEHSEGDLSIPVTLKIKDSPELPIVVLLIGVSLAIALANYQANGFNQDEIDGKVARLRSQMQTQMKNLTEAERAVSEIFRNRVEALLIDVTRRLEVKNWVEARQRTDDAQTTWNRWRQQQNDWLDLYQYVGESLQCYLANDTIPETTAAAKFLQLTLNQVLRQMPDCSNPSEFSEQLQPLQVMFQRYLAAVGQVKVLDHLMGHAGDRAEDFRAEVVVRKAELDQLLPNDAAAFQGWTEQVSQLQQDLEVAIGQQDPAIAANTRSAIVAAVMPRVASVPNVLIDEAIEEAAQAGQIRMKLFQIVGQGCIIALLCGIGLKQLYGANSTFGSDWIYDYTGLLAWGFSVEITRDSLSKISQQFKLPGSAEK